MFKVLIASSLITLAASFSHASESTDCPAQVPCGTYEGTGSWYDSAGQPKAGRSYSEKIVLSKVDENTINIKVYIYQGTIGKPWTDSNMIFDSNGHFVMKNAAQGYEFGSGFCVKEACTVAFQPVNVTRENPPFINTFVDVLRFEGRTLKRFNMVVDGMTDAERFSQVSTLTLQ